MEPRKFLKAPRQTLSSTTKTLNNSAVEDLSCDRSSFYVVEEIFFVQPDYKVRKFAHLGNGMRFARKPSSSAKPAACKFGIDSQKNRLQLLRRGTGAVSSPLWAGVSCDDCGKIQRDLSIWMDI